jgi:hypothetical protein
MDLRLARVQLKEQIMIKLFKAYEVREAIKAAGGRWNGEQKCWVVTADQFATLDQAALQAAGVEVERPFQMPEFVAIEPGDKITFALAVSEPVPGWVFERNYVIVAQSERGAVAAWQSTNSVEARGTDNYYDRHRIAKGDASTLDVARAKFGATDEVLALLQAQIPAAVPATLAPANWGGGEQGEFFFVECFAGLRAPFFGNMDKAAQRRADKAAKALVLVA